MGCHAAVRDVRQRGRAGDAGKPLGGRAPEGHVRHAEAGIRTSRGTGAIKFQGRDGNPNLGFYPGAQ